MSLGTRAYRRELWRIAVEHSKRWFWIKKEAAFAFVGVSIAAVTLHLAFQGWSEAAASLGTLAIRVIAANALWALVVLVTNLLRAPYLAHVERLKQILAIERERDVALAQLTRRESEEVPTKKPKRGVAELLEVELSAGDELRQWVPQINETLQEIARLVESHHSEVANVVRSTKDNRLQRKRNREAFDGFARRLSAILPRLNTRVNGVERAMMELAEVYAGYVEWATGPRHTKISLDSLKDRCRATIGIWALRRFECSGLS